MIQAKKWKTSRVSSKSDAMLASLKVQYKKIMLEMKLDIICLHKAVDGSYNIGSDLNLAAFTIAKKSLTVKSYAETVTPRTGTVVTCQCVPIMADKEHILLL